MKKVLSWFIILSMLTMPIQAFAAIGDAPPAVYIEYDGEFSEGNIVTCNVYIKDNPGFATMVYEVWFEKGVLSPVIGSIQKSNTVFAGGSVASNIDANSGNNPDALEYVKFVWVKPSNCRAQDGFLYSFKFNVLSDDANENSITPKLASMYNSNNRSLLYAKGDTDTDGNITAHDLVIYLHPKEYRDITAGDIDDSGITDKTDFNLLGVHIVQKFNNFSLAEKFSGTKIKINEFIPTQNGYKIPVKVSAEISATEFVIEYNSEKLEFVSCESELGSLFTHSEKGRLNCIFVRNGTYAFDDDVMMYLYFNKTGTLATSDLIVKDAVFWGDSSKAMGFENVSGINFSISDIIFAEEKLDFNINSSFTKGLVIIAVYEPDGTFLNLEYHNALEVLPVSLKNIKAGNKIKVFWWESFLGNPVIGHQEHIVN